jgi:hypothetical protein
MKITKEIKEKIKGIIKQLPKEIDERLPYELMVYTYVDDNGRTDFNDFDGFEGIGKLNKAIERIISNYKDKLYCIDFKYSFEEGEFDQFTIYTHNK